MQVIEIDCEEDDTIAEMKAFREVHYLLREVFNVNNDKHRDLFMELSITKDDKEVE